MPLSRCLHQTKRNQKCQLVLDPILDSSWWLTHTPGTSQSPRNRKFQKGTGISEWQSLSQTVPLMLSGQALELNQVTRPPSNWFHPRWLQQTCWRDWKSLRENAGKALKKALDVIFYLIQNRMPDETEGLELAREYSQNACQFECALKKSLEFCKCKPWNYPWSNKDIQTNVTLCDMYGNYCFFHAMSKVSI